MYKCCMYMCRDIAGVVRDLQRNITSSEFEMVVGRATLLKNVFKRMDKSTFKPQKKLTVSKCYSVMFSKIILL